MSMPDEEFDDLGEDELALLTRRFERLLVDSATDWMAVLANLASGGASWHALCPSRSGLEGGGVEIPHLVVVRMLTRGGS
jgi:hypothetical protein